MRRCSRLQPSFKAQVRMLCFFRTPWYQMETLQQIHCQIMLLLTRKAGGYHHDSYLCQILLDFLWFSGVAGAMYYSRVFFEARSGTDLKSYTSKNALGVDPQNSFYKSNRSVFPCKAVAKHQIHSKKGSGGKDFKNNNVTGVSAMALLFRAFPRSCGQMKSHRSCLVYCR